MIKPHGDGLCLRGHSETVHLIAIYHRLSNSPLQVRALAAELLPLLKSYPLPDNATIGDAFEFFDMKERQSKFIVNSVRNYEFHGFDWWLPFWDLEFTRFWWRVPRQLKVGKLLYNAYVDAVFPDWQTSIGRATVNQEKGRFEQIKSQVWRHGYFGIQMALNAQQLTNRYPGDGIGWFALAEGFGMRDKLLYKDINYFMVKLRLNEQGLQL